MAIKRYILKKLLYKDRKSFTLIELIFVIVITGLIAAVAFFSIGDNKLISDYQVLKEMILDKKTSALGYKKSGANVNQCIILDKDILNNGDNRVKYSFKSDISVSGIDSNVLCFDYLGRAYDLEVDEKMENLVHNKITVTLKYKDKEKNITIYPFGGAIN